MTYTDVYYSTYAPPSTPPEPEAPGTNSGEWRVEFELGGTWVNVSGDTIDVSVRRGTTNTEGVTATYEAGSFTVRLENRERQYEPGYNPNIKPGARCRIEASDGSVWKRVFTGVVTAWQASYTGGALHSEAVATGTDAVETLRRMKIEAIPEKDEEETPIPAVGSGDSASERVHRILDKAGWPFTDRDIVDGGVALQGTRWGKSVWDELNDVVKAESGSLWIDAQGRVAFRPLVATLDIPSEATFADDGTGHVYGEPRLSFDWQGLVNEVRYKRAGEPDDVQPATVEDEKSRAEWTHGFPSTLEDTQLIHLRVDDAKAWAHLQLLALSRPEHTIDTIVVEPLFDPSLTPKLLALDMASRVTVVFHPPGGGTAIHRACWVRGITQSRNDDVWRVELTLASATRFQFFKYNDFALSKLDDVALGPVAGTWDGGRNAATANTTVSFDDLNTLHNQMVMRFPSIPELFKSFPEPAPIGVMVWVKGMGFLYSDGKSWLVPRG